MDKTYKNIDAYISAQPKEVQPTLNKLRKVIVDNAPGVTEAIKYQMPTFVLNGNLIHFAAYKKHIGLYPAPSAIVKFEKDLKAYVTSKGAIQFPLDRDIPYDLVKKIVEFRVAENSSKGKKY